MRRTLQTTLEWSALKGLAALALLLLAEPSPARAAEAAPAVPASVAFDAAPFAEADYDATEHSYTLQWGEPRKVRQVVVEFANDAKLLGSDKLQLQYWHRTWSGKPDPIVAETGSFQAGWEATDDWSNGVWKDADTSCTAKGNVWTFSFEPTSNHEFPKVPAPGVAYRKTLKLRLLGNAALPRPARVQAFTDSAVRPLTVRIHWGEPKLKNLELGGEDAGRLEVYNGSIRALRALSPSVTVSNGAKWQLQGRQGSLEADLLMAVDPRSDRYDRTIVTVRSQGRSFSFAADEVARGDRVLVDDLGVLVTRADDPMGLEEYRKAREEFPGRTVYDRVLEQPEQTLDKAWKAMPLKRPLHFVHGLPGDRNVMRQDDTGTVLVSGRKRWFENSPSPKDSARKDWPGHWLMLDLGLPPAAGRELLDGYLPQVRTWWLDGSVFYELTTVLNTLDGDLDDIQLDDPTVLLMQLRVTNLSADAPGTARLHLSSKAILQEYAASPDTQSEKLILQGNRLLGQSEGTRRFRALWKTGDRGRLLEAGDALDWSLELPPGQTHTMQLLLPSVTLASDEEIERLGRQDFTTASAQLRTFWSHLAENSTKIETPEPWLNDFYKAHLRHMEINCTRDPKAPRRHSHVSSFLYGDFINESVMMVSDLDRRGCRTTAEQCLQMWLDFQGTRPLPGDFKSRDGVFYGSDGHEDGGYNKHHGYALWGMAEHWRYTRDRAWMERSAEKLIKACDWIIRERKQTMRTRPDGSRPIEYGFLPIGGLEDVQDYWYWLATNACGVWGFDALAEALADYGHAEAPRLVAEAKAYHEDVRRAFEEARIRTPVVRLRDGTYVPKYPSHLHERGRAVGWIRETLEGSVLLLLTGLVDPHSPQATWIYKDFEDNLFISDQYGYSIPVFDEFWFSRGGFSMQANLLDTPYCYLLSDDVPHFVRCFFNGFASAFYPQIRMCNEHSGPELGYPAGDHLKTSDEAQVTYWLRLMFVHERGDDLWLGQALPRYWLADGRSVAIQQAASHFGPLSLRIRSEAAQGRITAVFTPPDRNPPQKIYLRLRHPEGKPLQGVLLNGQKYDQFDAQKEWVILPGTLQGEQTVVGQY